MPVDASPVLWLHKHTMTNISYLSIVASSMTYINIALDAKHKLLSVVACT